LAQALLAQLGTTQQYPSGPWRVMMLSPGMDISMMPEMTWTYVPTMMWPPWHTETFPFAMGDGGQNVFHTPSAVDDTADHAMPEAQGRRRQNRRRGGRNRRGRAHSQHQCGEQEELAGLPSHPVPAVPDESASREASEQASMSSSPSDNMLVAEDLSHLGDPHRLLQHEGEFSLEEAKAKLAELVELAKLAKDDGHERRRVIAWLSPVAKELAISKPASRIVQAALEYGTADCAHLLSVLLPHTEELYQSPNGNHVLTKAITVSPHPKLSGFIQQLEGKTLELARHKFGCRVLERLIEHCSEEQIGGMVNELVWEAAVLSRHPFGNFVIKHLLEHGSTDCRSEIIRRLLPTVSLLAMHRTASHIVQQALTFGSSEDLRALILKLLESQSPNSFEDIACSRYGSFVVEQLAGICSIFLNLADLVETMKQRLFASLPILEDSQFGQRVAQRFGLRESRSNEKWP